MYPKRCRSSFILYLIFASTIIATHENSFLEPDRSWHLIALSQQGRIDFAHAYKQVNASSNIIPPHVSHHTISAPSYAAHTTAGPITLSCSTNPLSCFNLLCDAPRIGSALLNVVIKGCSHLFDTNGTHKRQHETAIIEEFLYAVDTHRLELYTHNYLPHAIIKDRQYLEDLRQEIILTIYTRTAPPGCYHAYCILETYITDAWRTLADQSNYALSSLEQAHHTVHMACKAVYFVTKAPIKNKKVKAQIVAQYKEALNFAHKQLVITEEAYAAQKVFSAQQNALIDYCTELHEYMPSERIAHRLEMLHRMDLAQPAITTKQYTVSETVTSALTAFDCDITQLRTHIGNTYQQLLHQELLTIAETATGINQSSPLFFQQETFFACAASAFEYNNVGSAYEATQIADFCWALLDYGGALLEGAITGASAAVLYATAHPFETTATVFAGQYLLAYQLSSLLYDVIKIGITATYDADTASQQWETLTQPITDLYDALTSAEITTRGKIKMATTIATSLYAQTKLIGGLQKFCSGILKQVKFFQRNNPQTTPVEYLATTEGQFLQVAAEACVQKPLTNSQRIQNDIVCNIRTGSALKKDSYHAFPDIVDNYAHFGKTFELIGNDGIKRMLYQVQGSLDAVDGIFEWILDPCINKGVTHRLFIPKGTITGKPNMHVKT